MRKGLHKAKQEGIRLCLEWIVDFMLDNGYQPSCYEITEGLGVSYTTLHSWLKELSAKGDIEWIGNGKQRAMRVRGVYYVDDRSEEENDHK